MLKLLLVDDEYLELNMLAENIDWQALGFTLVALAKNGQDAWEKVSQYLPDVVITDIKMPIIDGVMLAQKLYKNYPHIKVIFLSGYNQYEYMRSAMEVQALDYLLKPLDLDEIPPLMEKVKARCLEELKMAEKERVSAVQKIRTAVLLGIKPENEEEFIKQCCICSNSSSLSNDTFYMAAAVLSEYFYWKDNEEGQQIIARGRQHILRFAEEYHATAISIQEHTYLLLSSSPILPSSRDWEAADRGLWAIICCKKESVNAKNIPEAYAHLDRLRRWWITNCPTKPIIYEEEMEQKAGQVFPLQRLPELDTYLLLQHLRDGNEVRTNAWVLEYYERAKEESSNILTVNLFDFLYGSLIIPNKRLCQKMTSKAELYVKLFKIESTDVLVGEVCHYLKQLIEELNQSKSDPAEMIINHVREFIETNYAQSLSIDTLAEKFYFSGNYLRSIFKKYTGTTVLEYITEVRLKKAEFLIRTTPMTVTNISTEIGYSNPSYFCLLFAKKYGLTPNEYRNQAR